MILFLDFFISVARLALLLVVAVSFHGVSAAGAVPSNTTIGTFGPLNVFQPFANWLYPINESFPVEITLGNASLALYPPLLSPEPSPSSDFSFLSYSSFSLDCPYFV